MNRDLYEDMENSPWFVEKIKDSVYAQNIYAALCNMRWQPLEAWSVLKDEYWTCSWRAAGSLVADLRQANEDYLDFYCSGASEIEYDTVELASRRFVSEGTVTDEVREDLKKLGWQPSEWPND